MTGAAPEEAGNENKIQQLKFQSSVITPDLIV
jgi:hypothetical protein